MHAFLSNTGKKENRMCKALEEMGASVTHGAISTLLAVVCLSNSKSYVFIVFFRLWLTIVLCGIAHGMLLLPIVCIFCGPSPNKYEEEI